MSFNFEDPEFVELVRTTENHFGDKSFDKKTQRWKKYKDAHGHSIGYGHFLTETEKSLGFVTVDGKNYKIEEGLPDHAARSLLKRDIKEHYEKARAQFNKFAPGGLHWDQLPDISQAALTLITYNVGGIANKGGTKFGWPGLLTATMMGRSKDFEGELSRKGPDASRFRREADYLVGYMDRPSKGKTNLSMGEWASMVDKDESYLLAGSKAPDKSDISGLLPAYTAGITTTGKLLQVKATELRIQALKAKGVEAPSTPPKEVKSARGPEKAPETPSQPEKLGIGIYAADDGTIFEVMSDNTLREIVNGKAGKAL